MGGCQVRHGLASGLNRLGHPSSMVVFRKAKMWEVPPQRMLVPTSRQGQSKQAALVPRASRTRQAAEPGNFPPRGTATISQDT